MVSTETGTPLVSDYFVGLPAEHLTSAFQGYERVAEADLPKEIDTFLIGDQTKVPPAVLNSKNGNSSRAL